MLPGLFPYDFLSEQEIIKANLERLSQAFGTLEHKIFQGAQHGTALWVSAQIHGDEPAGSVAIDRVIREINDGSINLKSGYVVFAPRLNKAAIAINERFVDRNLNRRFLPTVLGTKPTEEDIIQSQAVKALDRFCTNASGQAFVLDLHSFHAPGEPHSWIYTDSHNPKQGRLRTALGAGTSYQQNFDFVSSLGPSRILCGWAAAYRGVSDPDEIKATTINPDVNASLATKILDGLGYKELAQRQAVLTALRREATSLGQRAYDLGAVSTTVECGQHTSDQGAEVAYTAIRRALAHTGITDVYEPQSIPRAFDLITTKEVHFKLAGDRLASRFHDLDALTTRQPVILDRLGQPRIITPAAASGEEYVTLFHNPNPNLPTGIEIAYLATRRKSAQLTA